MESDAELVDAWRAGDRGAGEALFERHYDAVARFFHNKVGDAASDLIQRAFLARSSCHRLASIRSDTSEFSQTITPSRPRIQIEPAAPLFDATVLQPWHTSSLSEAAPRARARLGWADREAPRADERIAVLIFRASKAEEHDAARSRQTPRCSTLVGRTHAPTG